MIFNNHYIFLNQNCLIFKFFYPLFQFIMQLTNIHTNVRDIKGWNSEIPEWSFQRLSESILSQSRRAFHRGGIAEIPWPKIVGPAEILNDDRPAGDRSRNTSSRFPSNQPITDKNDELRVLRNIRRKIDLERRWIDIDRSTNAWTLLTLKKNLIGRTKVINQAEGMEREEQASACVLENTHTLAKAWIRIIDESIRTGIYV